MRRAAGILFFCFAISSNARAVDFGFATNWVLPSESTITNETWILTDTADMQGVALDDYFVAGSTINLGGRMENDAWAAGQTVSFQGAVADHLRVAGSIVEMDGSVGANLIAVGKSIALGSNSLIKGNAHLLGEDVLVGGRVGGVLHVIATRATLDGAFSGDVHVTAEDIVVMPGTVIKGDLIYTCPKELFVDKKVMLKGELIRAQAQPSAWVPPSPSARQVTAIQIFLYVCAVIVGIVFIAIFPQFTSHSVRHLRQSPWKALLAGFAAFCLIPMVCFFAAFTLVGLSLSVLLALAYIMLIYLAKIIVALVTGGILFRRSGPQPFSRVVAALCLGMLALYCLTSLPVVGPIVWMSIVLAGLGAMTLAVISTQYSARMAVPPPAPPAPPRPPEIKQQDFNITGDQKPS